MVSFNGRFSLVVFVRLFFCCCCEEDGCCDGCCVGGATFIDTSLVVFLELSCCAVSRVIIGGSGCSSTSFSLSRDFCFLISVVVVEADESETGSFVMLT